MGKNKSSKKTAGLDFVINTFVEGIKDVESDLEKLRKKIESKPIRQEVKTDFVNTPATDKLAKINDKILKQKKEEFGLNKKALAKDRAGRGTRRPFEAMMMGIGSFMLIKYAAQVPLLWASALGDAMASVETESRKGHAYRQSLIDRNIGSKKFDEAVAKYSELSGEQGYKSRVRMASIYSQLEQRGTSIGSLNPNAMASVLQGLTLGMGMSDEQADKKLIELLTGKMSKEDKKTFGIKSRTPVQILEEINSTLSKNPVIASTMTGRSAASDMKFIKGAKNELLSRINDLWPNLFTEITNPMKEFTKTFFGLDNDNVKAEWITTLSTIRDQVEKVFTKKNAEKISIFINRVVSAISMLIGTIGKFTLDHPLFTTALGTTALINKSKTGDILDFSWIFHKPIDVNVVNDDLGGLFGTPQSTIEGALSNVLRTYKIPIVIGAAAGAWFGNWAAEKKREIESLTHGITLEDMRIGNDEFVINENTKTIIEEEKDSNFKGYLRQSVFGEGEGYKEKTIINATNVFMEGKGWKTDYIINDSYITGGGM